MFLEISLGSGPAPIVGVEPGCGSPAWIRTTIHGSKGRCPTIRRPGMVARTRTSLALCCCELEAYARLFPAAAAMVFLRGRGTAGATAGCTGVPNIERTSRTVPRIEM